MKWGLLSVLAILWGCSHTEEPGLPMEPEFLEALQKLREKGCECGTEFYQSEEVLRLNITLSEASEAHARDMMERQFFSHVSPEGSSPQQRVHQAGYTGLFLGENIAQGYRSVGEVLIAWQESTSHCEAMMNPKANEIGIAEVNGYWVLELGQQ